MILVQLIADTTDVSRSNVQRIVRRVELLRKSQPMHTSIIPRNRRMSACSKHLWGRCIGGIASKPSARMIRILAALYDERPSWWGVYLLLKKILVEVWVLGVTALFNE